MLVFEILVGIAALTLGRKLFWVFVGAIGFVFGFIIATQFFYNQSDWIVLIISLVAGLLGTIFAIFLQRLALWLAGFVAGGYFIISLLNILGWKTDHLSLLFFIIGGIIGVLLVITLFDWALIILSSLTGAAFIAQAFQFGRMITALLFTLLFVVGLITQAGLMKREQHPNPDKPEKCLK